MRFRNSFNTVGNQLTAGKRVAHTDMAHGDTIANPDGIKLKRNPTSLANFLFCNFSQFLQVGMTGNQFIIGVADSDKGFAKIVV